MASARLQREGWRAQVRMIVLQDTAGAIALVERFLAQSPLEQLDPTGGTHLNLARFFTAVRRPARARALIAAYDRLDLEDGLRRQQRTQRDAAAEFVRLADAPASDRIAWIQHTREDAGCPVCLVPPLAETFERAGMPDSAIAYYNEYIATPWLYRTEIDALWLPHAHERLAALYEQRGDTREAMMHLTRFTELWRDADPVLMPRVQAARRRLELLAARRG
jgi:tetratricopeptide (TPR) repeat protein